MIGDEGVNAAAGLSCALDNRREEGLSVVSHQCSWTASSPTFASRMIDMS